MISNKDMKDIKIVNSLGGMSLLIKVVTHTIENQMKEQNSGFLGMMLVSLGTSFFGNILADKGIMWIGEDVITTWQDFQCRLILWLISKYKSIIRINLNPNTIKDGTYMVNLDEYKSIRTNRYSRRNQDIYLP